MSDLFARTFGEVSWCWPKDEQVGSWLASHTLYGYMQVDVYRQPVHLMWIRRSGGSTLRLSGRSGRTNVRWDGTIRSSSSAPESPASQPSLSLSLSLTLSLPLSIIYIYTFISGKSTFMRNLRVVHGSGFSMKERQDAREVSWNVWLCWV